MEQFKTLFCSENIDKESMIDRVEECVKTVLANTTSSEKIITEIGDYIFVKYPHNKRVKFFVVLLRNDENKPIVVCDAVSPQKIHSYVLIKECDDGEVEYTEEILVLEIPAFQIRAFLGMDKIAQKYYISYNFNSRKHFTRLPLSADIRDIKVESLSLIWHIILSYVKLDNIVDVIEYIRNNMAMFDNEYNNITKMRNDKNLTDEDFIKKIQEMNISSHTTPKITEINKILPISDSYEGQKFQIKDITGRHFLIIYHKNGTANVRYPIMECSKESNLLRLYASKNYTTTKTVGYWLIYEFLQDFVHARGPMELSVARDTILKYKDFL